MAIEGGLVYLNNILVVYWSLRKNAQGRNAHGKKHYSEKGQLEILVGELFLITAIYFTLVA